jgi:hypothetical protein
MQPPPIPPKLQQDHSVTYPPPKNDLQSSFAHISPLTMRSRPEAYSSGSGTGTGTSSSSGSDRRARLHHSTSSRCSSTELHSILNGQNKEVVSPSNFPSLESYSNSGSFGATSIGAEGAAIHAVPKAAYSWNERVDRQALGVRPGEVEIGPRIIPFM